LYKIKIETAKPYELALVGDMHNGHINCDYDSVAQVKRWLMRSPKQRGWAGQGDYNESVMPTKGPFGAMWYQGMSPKVQRKWFTDYWMDCPPEWLIRGNHEDRILKLTSDCPVEIMAKDLGCLYADIGGFIEVTVGEEPYLFYVRHGYGSSETTWFHVIKLIRNRRIQCDVMAIGHIHRIAHEFFDYEAPEGWKTMHGVRTGGYLRDPEYADLVFYSHAQIGSPVIKMWPNKHRVEVDINKLRFD